MKPTSGWFEVSGQSARLRVEPGGWLVGTTPTARDAAALLREQPLFRAPVKAMETGRLRAEVPLGSDLGTSFLLVHQALEESLRRLSGLEPGAVDAEDNGSRVADLLEECGYEHAADGNAFVVTLDGPKTARVESAGSTWIARAELVRLRDPADATIAALEHFLLALNGRLRFARGSLFRDSAALEVFYPAASLSADIVEKALGALTVGVDWAHRECRALAEAALANRYLIFHQH